MDFNALVKALVDHGPWAIVAIQTGAIGWVARAYVQTRDRHEQFQRDLLGQMQNILTESTAASVRQSETNERVSETIERMDRRLENVEAR